MESSNRVNPHVVHVGIVAIGRNEGDRLRDCLRTLQQESESVVYVDSGSTDGSVEFARSIGVEVVELDTTVAFTAARARNTGIERLLQRWDGVRFIQVLDGDCTIVSGWIESAHRFLTEHQRVGVVCGRRRERYPEQSVYNRLIDLEWDTPIGRAKSCGGDAMFRVDAIQSVGGYRDSLIAGEEPELCVRLRAAGWEVHRLDAEMTLHDAAITRFSQFWKRAKRAGHAYAEGAALHGRGPDRHGVRAVRSALVWGLLIPVLALLMVWPTWGLSLLAFAGLLTIQIWRIRRNEIARGRSPDDAVLLAVTVMVAKPAQALGVLRYWRRRLLGQRPSLIEYKQSSVPSAGDAPYV